MGDLHGDPRSFSAPLFVLFWGGGLSPLRCLFSKNLPLGGLYGESRFFLYSATCSFLGGGVRFFSAFNAVLFCTFVVWRVVRAFGYVFCCVWAFGAPVWVCRQLAL